jgi:flagellar basal-body rod protein FlgB
MLDASGIGETSGARGTDLLSLGRSRLTWLEQRQQVLASNVANADTPGYAPRDVTPFQGALGQFDITPTVTNAAHIGARSGSTQITTRAPSERSLNGNGLSLDHELEQIADLGDQQHLAVNLYTKYMTMFQTALGK